VNGNSIDRGRRFDPVLTRDMTGAQRKNGPPSAPKHATLFDGSISGGRADLSKNAALNPNDALANYQLGLTLMQLAVQDAVDRFGKMSNSIPTKKTMRIRCFDGPMSRELEQWEDAFVHFSNSL